MAFESMDENITAVRIDESDIGGVGQGVATIGQTMNFALTDPTGVIRKGNNGAIFNNGDVIAMNSDGTTYGVVTVFTFTDLPTNISLVGQVVVVGGVYSLIQYSTTTHSHYYETTTNVPVDANKVQRLLTQFIAPLNQIVGEFKIPNIPLTEFELMEFVNTTGATGSGILYLSVKDVSSGGVYDLEDSTGDFLNRTTANDIPLFINYTGVDANDYALLDDNTIPTGIFTRDVNYNKMTADMTLFGNFGVGSSIILRYQTVPFNQFASIADAVTNNAYQTDPGLPGSNFKYGAFYSGDQTRNIYNYTPVGDSTGYASSEVWTTAGYAGQGRCFINTDNSSYGFEDWYDVDFNEATISTTPTLDVDVVVPGGTYYVDITVGTTSGNGGKASPYNYQQFSDFIKNSIVDGDVLYVRGQYEVPDTTPLFLDTLRNIGSQATITIRGWDIETNGCPIIKWTYNDPDPTTTPWNNINVQNNSWWLADNAQNVDVVFQDIIMTSNGNFVLEEAMDGFTRTYKNVLFTANIFNATKATNGTTERFVFYGCTFNTQSTTFTVLPNDVSMFDCVLDNGTISISQVSKLIFSDNITNVLNFTDSVSNVGDISEYSVPVYDDSIISTPLISDFTSFVGVYTNSLLMYYGNYNVPLYNTSFMQNFRIDNEYNNGLFNSPRTSYGAYTFGVPIPVVDEFPTSGHIGAFYFGGEYSNGDANGNSFINILPVNGTATVDAKVNVELSNVVLGIPVKAFATGVQNFALDFVAKSRVDQTYPKFCGDTTNVCDTCECDDIYNPTGHPDFDDCDDYNTPVAGGNPLTVEFLACAVAINEYAEYVPSVYKWWFDYENFPEEYVSCAGTSATHTYCGGYLEEYDVRLCVDFTGEPLPDTIPPIITVIPNEDTIYVQEGTQYTDQGATAWDETDGDLTNLIVTTNPVDVNTADSYIVGYSVADRAGNVGEAFRPVVVYTNALGELHYNDGSFVSIYDANSNLIIDPAEAITALSAHGQTIDNITSVSTLVDCIGVSTSAFINEPSYPWNLVGGVDFSQSVALATIGDSAFRYWNATNMVTDLVIPDTVTTIDDYAFDGWTYMTQGVTFEMVAPPIIGAGVFADWSAPIEVTVPPTADLCVWKTELTNAGSFSSINGVDWDTICGIGYLTFSDGSTNTILSSVGDNVMRPVDSQNAVTTVGKVYSDVTKVTILPSCITINNDVFSNSTNYPWNPVDGVDFTLASNLLQISDGAFTGWDVNDVQLVIPPSVTILETHAFYGWRSNTKQLVIPATIKVVNSRTFDYWVANNAQLIISEGVETLDSQAFSYWYGNNKPVVIPSTITSIGSNAFSSWRANTHPVEFKSVTPPTIDNNAFFGWSAQPYAGMTVIVPVGANFSEWKSELVGFGSNVEKICNPGLTNCVLWNNIP